MNSPDPAKGSKPHWAGVVLAILLAAPSLGAALEGYYRIMGVSASGDVSLANWRPITSLSYTTGSSVVFTKPVDNASPLLMQHVFRGQRVPLAHLYIRNIGETFPVFMLNLKDVVVTGYQLGSSVESGPYESITLNFASFETSVTYSEADKTISSSTAAWNFSTGTLVTGAPPTLTLGATTLTTKEDIPVSMSYTISDDYSDPETITRTAASSNPGLVAPTGLVVSGTGDSRKVTVTPVANAAGTTTITLTARDTAGLTSTASFTLTVTPVNDAPVVTAAASSTTTVGVPGTVNVSLADPDNDPATLSLNAVSNNAVVLPESGIAITGSGANRTLTFTPIAPGMVTVTLTASDGSATSVPVEITLFANGGGSGIPNGVPMDVTLTGTNVPENAANGTVVGVLGVVDTQLSSGHVLQLVDDAGGRFALAGTNLVVGDGKLLDHETANAHEITIRVSDPNGGPFPDSRTLSKQFTINVTNVNEPPVVAIGPLGPAATGRPLVIRTISFTDPDAGAAAVRVTCSVLKGTLSCDVGGILAGRVSGNQTANVVITAALADLNAAIAAGALTYIPAAGFTGDELLQVTCSDLGQSGSGSALTDTRVASILVAVDSFAAWQARNFNAKDLADPSISGALAVRQPDGLTNLLKYALDLDPNTIATSGPRITPESGGWVFTYQRPASRPDLVYAVEISTDLKNWGTAGVVHTLASTDPATGRQTWRANASGVSSPKVFVRLSVSLRGASAN